VVRLASPLEITESDMHANRFNNFTNYGVGIGLRAPITITF
jgi:hypothetical protein